MKNLFALLVLLAMGSFVSNTYAVNPNPKPTCTKGQIAVLDGNSWQCKKPARKSNSTNTKGDTSKPAAVTYGPVITVKPKGMHEQKGCSKDVAGKKDPKTPSDPQASSPASQRDKCFTNH